MVQFQCRSVTFRGDERCWENLDDYWKGLMFKYEEVSDGNTTHSTHYVGNPHEGLVQPSGLRILKTPFIYEHVNFHVFKVEFTVIFIQILNSTKLVK